FATVEGLPGVVKIFQRQRQGTPSTGRRAPIMVRRTKADHRDLVMRHLGTADMHGRLALISAEHKCRPLAARRVVQDSSQAFVAAMHPDPVQVHTYQLDAVVTPR